MDETGPATKLQIAMNFLPDGRVGLELIEGWYLSHDLRVADVEDLAETARILRRWSSGAHDKPAPRNESRAAFPEYRDAYVVTLSETANDSLRRFAEAPELLSRAFALAFGSADSGDRSAASERFADDLAREMRRFVARCRRKAAARLAGGSYLAVLETHLADLRAVRAIDDQNYYETLKWGIGGIMQDEQYLLLAEDSDARDLYLRIQNEQRSLYNWHMDLAKGGHARAR